MSGPAPLGGESSPRTSFAHARYVVARLNYDAALLALLSAGASFEDVQREHDLTCLLMRKIAHVMGRGETP